MVSMLTLPEKGVDGIISVRYMDRIPIGGREKRVSATSTKKNSVPSIFFLGKNI